MGTHYHNEKYYIYFFESLNNIKIGISFDCIKRLRTLQKLSAIEIKCLKTVSVNTRLEARHYEKSFHKLFEKDRIHGEWFRKTDLLLKFIELLEI